MPRETSIVVKGTDGNDILKVPDGATLSKTSFDGARGHDVLDLSSYASPGVCVIIAFGFAKASSSVYETPFTGIFADLSGAPKVAGSIKNIENLIGTPGNDLLMLNTPVSSTKYVDGGAGNDRVAPCGGLGVGGTGSDWVVSSKAANILVGGTYVDGVATADLERDYFQIASSATILDFEFTETVQDKLLIDTYMTSIADYENAAWVDDGNGGASLSVNGRHVATLANIDPVRAESVVLGFMIGSTNGILEGSVGDDVLIASKWSADRVIVGATSGHDYVVNFASSDVLVFEDNVVPEWSDTFVNGLPVLVGKWNGGSVTLEGYTTASLPTIVIEGVSGPLQTAAPGMSAWSVTSDADYFL